MSKDLLERAAWTFVQAFVAAFLVNAVAIHSIATAKVAFIAAVAAGFSALKTFVKATA